MLSDWTGSSIRNFPSAESDHRNISCPCLETQSSLFRGGKSFFGSFEKIHIIDLCMKFYFLFSVVNTYETKRTAEQGNRNIYKI